MSSREHQSRISTRAPRRRRAWRGALAGVLIASGVVAHAGTASVGTISAVHFMTSGVVLFSPSGSRSGLPACAATQPSRFALNAIGAAGQTQLASVLAAYAAGKCVYVHGTGVCDVYGDSETLNFFYTVD